MAACEGHVDTVRYLVNKGADVNIQDSKAVSECEYTADCELKHVTGKHLFSVTPPLFWDC